MISITDALTSLIKQIDGTMKAADLALTSSNTPADAVEPITYEGDLGEVRLEFSDNVINVKCKKADGEWKTAAETLFDPGEDDWDEKATKSVANTICEAVASSFGTDCVFAGKTAKTGAKEKETKVIDVTEAVSSKKSKKNKEAASQYDIITFTNRMETIFPDLKGEMLKNIDKYDIYLPEEYFETLITPRVMKALRENDRPLLKKLFSAFSTFYNEGDNDMQSLIVVSILGMNLSKEEDLLKNCEKLMDENLLNALTPVLKYLKTGGAKKRISSFASPKPKAGK